MFRQMLFVQWKWNRDVLAFLVLAAFATPLWAFWLSTRGIGADAVSAQELMTSGRIVGGFCLVWAIIAGGAIAVQGYGMDDRTGHVYALSLPVSRSRFLATRSAAGFALLGLPALAAYLGAWLTVSQVAVPDSIRAYPGALALRLLLGAWLAHSVIFAVRYTSGRRSKGVFLVLLLAFGCSGMLFGLVPEARRVLGAIATALSADPGPFGILFGRWSLFDV